MENSVSEVQQKCNAKCISLGRQAILLPRIVWCTSCAKFMIILLVILRLVWSLWQIGKSICKLLHWGVLSSDLCLYTWYLCGDAVMFGRQARGKTHGWLPSFPGSFTCSASHLLLLLPPKYANPVKPLGNSSPLGTPRQKMMQEGKQHGKLIAWPVLYQQEKSPTLKVCSTLFKELKGPGGNLSGLSGCLTPTRLWVQSHVPNNKNKKDKEFKMAVKEYGFKSTFVIGIIVNIAPGCQMTTLDWKVSV